MIGTHISTDATDRRNDSAAVTDDEAATENEPAEQVCPECDGAVVNDDSRGESTCEDCGLVISVDHIDHGPEWREFSHEDKRNRDRTGSPLTEAMHDRGLSTTIDWKDKDAYGEPLSESQRQQVNRLRTRQKRSVSSSDRRLRRGFGEIKRINSHFELGDNVLEEACLLHRRTQTDDSLIGRSIEGVAAASFYLAARMHECPVTIREVNELTTTEKKKLNNTISYLVREFNLKIEPPNPRNHLPKVLSELGGRNGVSRMVRHAAQEILERYVSQGLHSGVDPRSAASGAVYVANKMLDEPMTLTQKEASEAADVSAVTVRNRTKQMDNIDDVESIVCDAAKRFSRNPNDGKKPATANGGESPANHPKTSTAPADNSATPDVDVKANDDDGRTDGAIKNNTGGADTDAYADVDGGAVVRSKANPSSGLDVAWEDDETLRITLGPDTGQFAAYREAVDVLFQNADLREVIGEVPYLPPGCRSRALLRADPDNRNASGRWCRLSNGLHLQTKLDRETKVNRVDHLADLVGVTVFLDNY